MVYKISKKDKFEDLRFIFPNLQIVTEYPAYSPVVLSQFEYFHPTADYFFLVNSGGVSLDSLSGILKFLDDISYLDTSQSKKLSTLSDAPLTSVFQNAASLKISNKLLSTSDSSISISQLVTGSYTSRFQSAESIGWSEALSLILDCLLKFYSPESRLSPAQIRLFSRLFERFDYRKYKKEYVLTGDMMTDCVCLQCLFGVTN